MSLFVNENNALGFNGLAEIIGILVFGAVALGKAYCHADPRMIPESFICQIEKWIYSAAVSIARGIVPEAVDVIVFAV